MIKETKLYMQVSNDFLELSKLRAGNSMKVTSLSMKVPECIDSLARCNIGSGHDVFLNGIMVFIDWKINKIVREQLLRYNFINVVSSNSLMHAKFPLAYKGRVYENIEDLPLSFEYWISFVCNYRQLKTIYKQRKNHKREEWREFCNEIKFLPHSDWIVS